MIFPLKISSLSNIIIATCTMCVKLNSFLSIQYCNWVHTGITVTYCQYMSEINVSNFILMSFYQLIVITIIVGNSLSAYLN